MVQLIALFVSDLDGAATQNSEETSQEDKAEAAMHDEIEGSGMPFDRILPKPVARRKQDSAEQMDDSGSKTSAVKPKKSGSLRAVSGNFIKAILSTRDKAHSCPPVPSSRIRNERVAYPPLR